MSTSEDPNYGSYSNSEDDSPFFADMTLDLAEAHGIAETPEANRVTFSDRDMSDMPKMPMIPDDEVLGGAAMAPLSMEAKFESASSSADYAIASGESTSSIDIDSRKMASLSNSRPMQSSSTSSFSDTSGHRRLSSGYDSRSSMNLTPSARRWPRDVQWAVAFCIIVPICLCFPLLFAKRATTPSENSPSTEDWLATATSARLATLHTLMWGYAAALVLSRLLYRTMGGGDGDDARHVASQILLASAPISVSVYICLIVAMYFMLHQALLYMVIPLWYLARDIFLFRTWKITATTPGGRQAFFQALTCMTLDILSRSLRRSSFYRIVSLVLVVQLLVIGWWRWTLLAALQSHSFFWILLALIGGKWATGTVARLLTLIAAGGINSWFAEQNSLVEELGQKNNNHNDEDYDDDGDDEMIEFTSLTNGKRVSFISDEDGEIPEAYRTADASIYKSALVPDEGIDDDFDDEEEFGMMSHPRRRTFMQSPSPKGSTVKQLLLSGLTISSGSVAKCGLLGGFAQFLWSQLRKIDTARATFRNLQGMSIGDANEDSRLNQLLLQANHFAREFVRNNSDMGMSHVAAFQKSYQRAAQDVAILIDESGVEPMIHEDISTHMSSCIGGTISGVIVIFTGFVLVHQRNRNNPDVSDSAVLLDLLMAFVFCYTLIFTVMEPLRASIKAVYVSFAQHPEALSQAYPLIYHRLNRMSRSNLS